MSEWMVELLAYALCLIAIVGLAVYLRKANAAHGTLAQSERLADLGPAFGRSILSSIFSSVAFVVMLVGVVVIDTLMLSNDGKHNYVLVGVYSLPLVAICVYAIYRSERWWINKFLGIFMK